MKNGKFLQQKKGVTDLVYYLRRLLRAGRLLLLSMVNQRIHLNVMRCDISLCSELKVSGSGKIVVSDYVNTIGKTTISASGIVEIGSAGLNRYDIIACKNHIKIGKNCKFGPMVAIYDHDHQFDRSGVKDDFSLGEIIIGDNVWIGANCVILKNTHIGDGCVIGAGCVVQGDIPAHSLVTAGRDLTIVPIEDRRNGNSEK